MDSKYYKALGIYYLNELRSIHKSGNSLQPVFEAFSNAWEAIIERLTIDHIEKGKITIVFKYDSGLSNGNPVFTLNSIEVKDNGVGVNEKNFERLVTLRDSSKGASNKGTGRVQYLHFFDTTTFDSYYKTKDGAEHITLVLSKNDNFLAHNAILRKDSFERCNTNRFGTSVLFSSILDQKNDAKYYNELTSSAFKEELIIHFLSLFCENRRKLPKVRIQRYESGNLVDDINISESDIPMPDKEESVTVKYSRLDDNNKVVDSVSEEKFKLTSFIQPISKLPSNSIFFISKGALAQESAVDSLSKKDSIDGLRYLFLLSGEYFDMVDDDARGDLHLIKEADFKKQNEFSLYPEECLLVDHIKEATNRKIDSLYPDFGERHKEAIKNLEELQSMFLIDDDSITEMKKKLKTSDSDESILRSIYQSDMVIMAKRDAEIKEQFKQLKKLSPDQDNYQEQLSIQIDEFVKLVPQQNRTNLTKYLARRKLVLELFDIVFS